MIDWSIEPSIYGVHCVAWRFDCCPDRAVSLKTQAHNCRTDYESCNDTL